MTVGLIYIAVCSVTGRGYVGQTTQGFALRRQQHEYEALARKSDGCTRFYRALRKHGAAAFAWRVLADGIPCEKLDAAEAHFIAEIGTADDGYNICREGVTTRGVKLSAETRRRMSEATRPPKSAEHLAKLGAARRGKRLSPEWCARIGDSKRGIKASTEAIEKRASKVRGRKQSPEAIAKRVASRKANGSKQPPWTEEQRAKIVAKLKGRVFTDEWKRKISEAKRAKSAQIGAP